MGPLLEELQPEEDISPHVFMPRVNAVSKYSYLVGSFNKSEGRIIFYVFGIIEKSKASQVFIETLKKNPESMAILGGTRIGCPSNPNSSYIMYDPPNKTVTYQGEDGEVRNCFVSFYEPEEILSSKLLYEKCFLSRHQSSDRIIQHLVAGVISYHKNLKEHNVKRVNKIRKKINTFVWLFIMLISKLLILIVDKFETLTCLLEKWIYVPLTTSTLIGQLIQRCKQVQCILEEAGKGYLSLKNTTALVIITIDVCSGILIMYCIQKYISVIELFDIFVYVTQYLMHYLKELLQWLMGVPAGLKLNFPLNTALGSFFLYHIHLWQTYIDIIRPILEGMLATMFFLGYLGTTFLLAMLSDLLSLATLHVYCFYVYAARLYHLQLSGLLSLGRLFRGKKWNVLRQRVDSCSYDMDQLFLGTLLFTVLLFIFFTTAVYYVVFTTLRLFFLVLYGLLKNMVRYLSICPFYVIVLSFIKPSYITGNIRFEIIPTSDERFLLSVKTTGVPFTEVIKHSLPDYFAEYEPVVVKKTIYNIIQGIILH